MDRIGGLWGLLRSKRRLRVVAAAATFTRVLLHTDLDLATITITQLPLDGAGWVCVGALNAAALNCVALEQLYSRTRTAAVVCS